VGKDLELEQTIPRGQFGFADVAWPPVARVPQSVARVAGARMNPAAGHHSKADDMTKRYPGGIAREREAKRQSNR